MVVEENTMTGAGTVTVLWLGRLDNLIDRGASPLNRHHVPSKAGPFPRQITPSFYTPE